jgi:hypothetical protein
MSEELEKQVESKTGSIAFRTSKGAAFRLVHANGFWIQPDPHAGGGCRLSAYSDRVPFPQREELKLNTDGVPMSAADGDDEEVSEFEREVEIEIAVSDKQMVALLQNIQNYLMWRGVLKPKSNQP